MQIESVKHITDRFHHEPVKTPEYIESIETYEIWVKILSRIGGLP